MSFTCKEIQQHFYYTLGNRDYDCFQSSEKPHLKMKIAYTLFGSPENVEYDNLDRQFTVQQCYNKDQNKILDSVLEQILLCGKHNEDRDQVILSCMFNCCELNKRKLNKSTTDDNLSNIECYPIFRVKKCVGSPTGNNCCNFIDEHARVYKDWQDYLEHNKIPAAKMFAPKDGIYKGNEDNKVLLDVLMSPAASIGRKLSKGADITSTAISVGASVVGIGAMIPAVTVAPILLTGALISGAGVGLYSIIRSSVVLHDRRTHQQSISLGNDESRNCYLNIAAGATGVVTTGATKLASLAVKQGVTITEAAATALLTVNVVNLGVNGCNVGNTLYCVINDIKNKKAPSTLDIFHLTSTVLFFGHAVVNFQSACTIYKETQSKSFPELVNSRSQELWNRAKETFFKSDMTVPDQTSSMKKINDATDLCSNAIQCGLPLQNETAVNHDFLESCFKEFISLENTLNLGLKIYENKENVLAICQLILARFSFVIQEKLLKLVKWLMGKLVRDVFDDLSQLFPKTGKIVIFLNFVIQYLKLKCTELEIEYQQKKANAMRNLQISDEEYEKTASGFKSGFERTTYFFKICLFKMFLDNGKPCEIFCQELVRFFWDWLSEKMLEYALKASQTSERVVEKIRERIHCNTCGGFYFVDK